MQWIEFVKAVPGYLEGAVVSVDENSAKVLVERGDAKEAEDPGQRGGMFATSASRAGFVTQIAEADPPPDQQRAEVEAVGTKAELVELAKGKLVDDAGVALSDDEVAKLTKAELKSRLEGPEGAGGASGGGSGGVTGLGSGGSGVSSTVG